MSARRKTVPKSVQTDDMFLNQFPNLVPNIEQGYSVFNLGTEKHDQRSIQVGERFRLASLLKEVARARVHVRQHHSAIHEIVLQEAALKAIHAHYQNGYGLREENFSRDHEWFVSSIKYARRLLEDLVKNFFPTPYQKQLEMTSDIDTENNPLRLLRLCCGTGSDVLSERRRFEARRLLTLAQLLFESRLFGHGPDDLERDMSRLDDDLKLHFFLPFQSVSYKIVAELSSRNRYRVRPDGLVVKPLGPKDTRLHSTATRRVLPTDMRFIYVDGRKIPVYYETRIKVDAIWKSIRKSQRHTFTLGDLCGVQFVFTDERDLLAGVDHLRRTIVREPGCYFGDVSNMARAGIADENNLHSAAEYRARKYFGYKYGRIFEIQIKLLRDWLNELFSRGDENHNLYRLRTFQDDLFPRLFPTSLYHLDWQDPCLRKTLVNLQLAKIWSI